MAAIHATFFTLLSPGDHVVVSDVVHCRVLGLFGSRLADKLALGADLVMHSLTRYINGHGDAMGGVVIGSRELVTQRKLGALHEVGGAISPINAWLITRGSITLPLRMRRHFDTAAEIAQFLHDDPRVTHVAYPGLAGDPGHERSARGGFGGVVSFAIAGDHAARVRSVGDLRLITSAVSLGHEETLVAYESYPPERAGAFARPFRDHGLIRPAIGLEDPADLIGDLDAALTTACGPRL